MTTYGTDALRKVVAERGIGSNIHVMDIAARIQMALDAKDAKIADIETRLAEQTRLLETLRRVTGRR